VPSDRADRDQVEHFLVDGVAPPVIGGGPPESPFDLEPDPEPEPRQRPQPRGGPAHVPVGMFDRPAYEHGQRPVAHEPPTTPIPALGPVSQEQEKRKSWVSRMFRLPDR